MLFISSNNIWRQSCLGAFLLICSSTTVWAGNLTNCTIHINNKPEINLLPNPVVNPEAHPFLLTALEAPESDKSVAFNIAEAAAQYKEGMRYLLGVEDKPIDNNEAIKLLKLAAAAQHVEAQTVLGKYYLTGLSDALEKNPAKGIELLKEAAKQNSPEAIVQLGYAHITGVSEVLPKKPKLGFDMIKALNPNLAVTQCALAYIYKNGIPKLVKPNIPLALELYQKAAAQGYVDAQVNLGIIYHDGIADVILPNKQKEEQLAIDAAKQGNATGRFNLAYFYLHGGETIKQDLKQALKLYQLAAAQDLAAAKYMLALSFYVSGIPGIAAQNTELAMQLYHAAAKQGMPEAQYALAIRYFNGTSGLPKNVPQAISLLQSAAKNNHAVSQFRLAQFYLSGIDDNFPQDVPAAVELFQLAAKQNHAEAQYALAIHYFSGTSGLPKNVPQAISLLQSAAKQNHAFSQFFLAQLYLSGIDDNFPQDVPAAVELFQLAAKQNHAEAQYFLGIFYLIGFGVPNDFKKAQESFSLVADRLTLEQQQDIGQTVQKVIIIQQTKMHPNLRVITVGEE